MKSLLVICGLLATFYFHFSSCIYLVNASDVPKNDNSRIGSEEEAIWGPLLEEWTLTSHRGKRVMQLPPSKDTFITDDSTAEQGKIYNNPSPNPGKIVTSTTSQPKPPGRQVSETDLYLLNAIEKLVYRMDFMEKRLRRTEEMLYYMVAGNRIDYQEPCPHNFTRVASKCYLFSTKLFKDSDWKVASSYCKRKAPGATLAELETIEENQDMVTFIQSSEVLRGKDFWTGGLNPGLLWIWSNSARPVNNKNKKTQISGDGRCLRLAYDPALRSYSYKGSDCSHHYGFICQVKEDKTSSNELRRLGRERKILDEL